MPVVFCEGDLFLSMAQTLAHGCNCHGRMGAGIALEFKARFPEMYRKYRRLCKSGEFRPGGAYLEMGTIPWILNLGTQDRDAASLEYIRTCFRWIAGNYRPEGILSFAVPRIGAGLGRLAWNEVRVLLLEFLDPLPLPVYVYEKYEPGPKSSRKI